MGKTGNVLTLFNSTCTAAVGAQPPAAAFWPAVDVIVDECHRLFHKKLLLPAAQTLLLVHRPRGQPRRACRRTATPAAAMATPFLFTPVESGLGGLTLGLLSYAKFSITGR